MLGNQQAAPKCTLKFLGYDSSDWEAEWRSKAEDYQHKACKTMLAQADRVDAWMEPMNASFSRAAIAAELPQMQNTQVGAAHCSGFLAFNKATA